MKNYMGEYRIAVTGGYSNWCSHEKTASLNDAIVLAKKRIASIEQLPRTEDVEKQIINARAVLGLYMFQLFYFVEAKETIDPITEMVFRSGNKKRIAQIHTILGTYSLWIEEDFPKAFEHLELALGISLKIGDTVAQFFASQWLGFARSFNCEFEQAFSHFRKALDINIAAKNIWGTSVVKSSLSKQVYNYQGMVKTGYETSEEALRIAEESGDIYSRAIAYSNHGVSCYLKGHLEEAEKQLLKGIGLSERINFFTLKANTCLILGNTYFDILEYPKAENYYKETIKNLEQSKSLKSMINLAKICRALTGVMKNEKDIDLEPLYDYVVRNKLKVNDGSMRRYIGEILLNMPGQPISDAQNWIEKAIEADSKNSTKWNLGKDYVVYSRFFKINGSKQKAKENLSKAIEIFKECGADGWVTRTEKTLAEIS